MPAKEFSYATSRYSLDLDGAPAGKVDTYTGGYATSDVVEEKTGADMIARKHLAGVKYEEITIQCGAGLSKTFYAWLSDTLDLKHSRKDGAVITADYSGKETTRLNFFHALVTEIGFPALDASSKDAAKLTVKFSPEYTRTAAGSGAAGARIDMQKQKKWLPSNFRLKIDGIDCTRVNKIAPLVLEQKVVADTVGETRDYQQVPALLEIPDLVVTFPESNAADFAAWHHDFVVQGNNGQNFEKNGTLELLASDSKTVLFTIGLFNLGIYKLAPEPAAAGSDSIRRLTAAMYCERMTLTSSADGTQTVLPDAGATNGAQAATATGTPVFVGDQEPPLVVVSGANGPIVTQDIPDSFTRIRRTT